MLMAPMTRPGVVLSQPPSSTAPSIGMAAQQLLRLHRQEIAVEHGRRLDEGLGQRHRRQLDREAAGLQHAALDVLGARAQMRVAGVDLAPGIDDADHRPAGPVVGVVAELAQARAMAERAQIADAEPAMAAQIFGTLAVHEMILTGDGATLYLARRSEHEGSKSCRAISGERRVEAATLRGAMRRLCRRSVR